MQCHTWIGLAYQTRLFLQDNILVDDEGHAMISDFGLSNETRERALDAVGGSLRWLAPELLFDDARDDNGADCPCSAPSTASDVWSFGCTVYEVCSATDVMEKLV